jgi:hypothetical protein
MKEYAGYEAKKSEAAGAALPAGGYVAKILGAEVKEYEWGDVLIISFDIAEGDYKGYFANRWKADENSDFERKWKGIYRLNIPSDKSRYPDSDKRNFNNCMWAVETSNKGYTWGWDESTLKGKMIGVLFSNREWEMNGNTGWTTECSHVTSIGDIRGGTFTTPKDKPLKKSETPKESPTEQAQKLADIISDDELPF